jgi:hypothetical protein
LRTVATPVTDNDSDCVFLSFICNDMGDYYIKLAGHCTRYGEPFGHNATAYMVRETVAWSFVGDYALALTQPETVAVCDACVTIKEQANATEDSTCKGCGQRMKLNPFLRRRVVCSNRCEQRERRARCRGNKTRPCEVCGSKFVSCEPNQESVVALSERLEADQ